MYDDIKSVAPRREGINFKVSEKEKQDIYKFCEDNDFRVSAFCRVVIAEAIRDYDGKEK